MNDSTYVVIENCSAQLLQRIVDLLRKDLDDFKTIIQFIEIKTQQRKDQ